MIDLTITSKRINLRLTWGKQKPAAVAESTLTPVGTSYPLQIHPVGFAARRSVKAVR
ncbi:hypothetical protein [Kribbella sp. NPDC051718]|uniref:hypothetical protein n=1 Tax=Kribbella sp. NPDC051718 TaxID=3155168 RepID=UPI003423B481